MAVKPKTLDPAAMIRGGEFQPWIVFPPPPKLIKEGNLDDRAFEILEFIVWTYRIAQHKEVVGRGISWWVLQRWYDVGNDDDLKRRIYAALKLLVSEGYLQPGPPARLSPLAPLGILSDYVIPTEKGYTFVDRCQAAFYKKLWLLALDHRLIAALGTLATVVIGLAGIIISLR